MTRDEVLNVLASLTNLKWKGLATRDIAVHFLQTRVAVVLPEELFTADERIRLDGKFQQIMAVRFKQPAYLDYQPESAWRGATPPLKGGFS